MADEWARPFWVAPSRRGKEAVQEGKTRGKADRWRAPPVGPTLLLASSSHGKPLGL